MVGARYRKPDTDSAREGKGSSFRQPETGKLRLLIADPSPLVLHGFTRICEVDSRMQVLSQSIHLKDVAKLAVTERPSLTVVDWNLMSWGTSFQQQAVDSIADHSPLLFLSLEERLDHHKMALRVGAKGILSKRSSPVQIRKALWKVAGGGIWMERPIADALLEYTLAPKTSVDAELQRMNLVTRREREVMSLIGKGKPNKEIAVEMNISVTTVSHHLTSIFSKLQIGDRLELLAFIYRHSLESSDEAVNLDIRKRRHYQAAMEQRGLPA